MEKLESESLDKNESVHDNQIEDEQATTSRGRELEQMSHNMNDLKVLDFNSADEIRQAMKAILSGQTPQHFNDDVDQFSMLKNHGNIEAIKVDVEHKSAEDAPKVNKNIMTECKFPELGPKTSSYRPKTDVSKAKKRGRPPKPGPSKKIKREHISVMYVGKLSNVVPFTSRGDTESNSSGESSILFY